MEGERVGIETTSAAYNNSSDSKEIKPPSSMVGQWNNKVIEYVNDMNGLPKDVQDVIEASQEALKSEAAAEGKQFAEEQKAALQQVLFSAV